MAQSTSGTNLPTTAAAAARKLTVRLMIDWDDVGFSDTLSGWTDETQYLTTARGDLRAHNWRRSVAGVGGGVAGVCYVTLRNPDVGGGQGFRFSSSNANGPLYSKLGEGKINMVRAVLELGFFDGSTPERLRQITGYIVSAEENYVAGTVVFEIRDRAADTALTRASTAVYENTQARAYLEDLVDMIGRDPIVSGDQLFDPGAVLPEFQWLDDETIWDELAIIAEAQAGRVWFDKDGDLHFEDSGHWVRGNTNSYDDPTVSQATITVASMADLSPTYDLDSVWNHVIVEYSPRYRGWEQPVYTASEILTIAPSESGKEHRAQYHNPVLGALVTPEGETDYLAVTGGGEDITADVTITVANAYSGYAKLSMSNANSDYTAYLTKLQLRGVPLLSDAPIKVERENATSIAQYGRRTWTVRRNPYVQSEFHAIMLADFLLSRFKDPVQIIRLKGIPARPWLEPGDRITIQAALPGIDDPYLITEISWRYTPTQYSQDLTAIRVEDLFPYVPGPTTKPYFIVGVTQYGTHGRLFW